MKRSVQQQDTGDIVAIIDAILADAYEAGVSDVHLAPERTHIKVRFRIDGQLEDVHVLPLTLHAEVIARIKILAGLRTDEHSAAQDGRFRFRLGPDDWIDVRVSIMPTYYGENAVMRILALGAQIESLAQLGFSPSHLAILEQIQARPSGMVLATGPTGSGKTTTLYALLARSAEREVSVVTIEDPIEYSLDGINQIQTNERTGLTFAHGLRSILRQDPDIIMVGEVRDTETARLATNAALTGHQVFSTLHTNDAPTALIRLKDLGVEPYLITSTLSLVIAQRLVRRICAVCKVSILLETSQREVLEKVMPVESIPDSIFQGKGCTACNGTGYRGRVGIYELLPITDPIRALFLEDLPASELGRFARDFGYVPMFADGVEKVRAGVTSLQEVMRITHA